MVADELIGRCSLHLPDKKAMAGGHTWYLPIDTGGVLECKIFFTDSDAAQLASPRTAAATLAGAGVRSRLSQVGRGGASPRMIIRAAETGKVEEGNEPTGKETLGSDVPLEEVVARKLNLSATGYPASAGRRPSLDAAVDRLAAVATFTRRSTIASPGQVGRRASTAEEPALEHNNSVEGEDDDDEDDEDDEDDDGDEEDEGDEGDEDDEDDEDADGLAEVVVGPRASTADGKDIEDGIVLEHTHTISLDIVRARELQRVQVFGAEDPYVKAYLLPSKQCVTTGVAESGGGSPFWVGKSGQVRFGHHPKAPLHGILLEVWNKNSYTGDEIMGSCLILVKAKDMANAKQMATERHPVNTGGAIECRRAYLSAGAPGSEEEEAARVMAEGAAEEHERRKGQDYAAENEGVSPGSGLTEETDDDDGDSLSEGDQEEERTFFKSPSATKHRMLARAVQEKQAAEDAGTALASRKKPAGLALDLSAEDGHDGADPHPFTPRNGEAEQLPFADGNNQATTPPAEQRRNAGSPPKPPHAELAASDGAAGACASPLDPLISDPKAFIAAWRLARKNSPMPGGQRPPGSPTERASAMLERVRAQREAADAAADEMQRVAQDASRKFLAGWRERNASAKSESQAL
jgi:hypothetical protein